MKKKGIIIALCTMVLIAWQNKTIKKRTAALYGPFNHWVTVCLSTPIAQIADSALKNAGALFKYEREITTTEGTQPQTCYIKLFHSKEHSPPPYARYQCTGFFGGYADMVKQSIDYGPCKLYFHKNTPLKEQFERADEDALSVDSIQEAVEIIKK